MFIYKITNMINKKIYVGQTTESLEKRFKRHMGYQKESHDTKFYRAVRKYGVENFKIELIEEVRTQEELNQREEYWIRKLDSVNRVYNSYYGGFSSGGDTLSEHPDLENIKKKLRKAKLGGDNPMSTKFKCIDLETGKEYLFDSMADCQRKMDIPRHDIISRRCRGKIKKPYQNRYMFEYIV